MYDIDIVIDSAIDHLLNGEPLPAGYGPILESYGVSVEALENQIMYEGLSDIYNANEFEEGVDVMIMGPEWTRTTTDED